jgi:hypothetical protein
MPVNDLLFKKGLLAAFLFASPEQTNRDSLQGRYYRPNATRWDSLQGRHDNVAGVGAINQSVRSNAAIAKAD